MSSSERNKNATLRVKSCPVCGQALSVVDPSAGVFPFCSARCKDVDFSRWARGEYRIAGPIDPRLSEDITGDIAEDSEDSSRQDN